MTPDPVPRERGIPNARETEADSRLPPTSYFKLFYFLQFSGAQ